MVNQKKNLFHQSVTKSASASVKSVIRRKQKSAQHKILRVLSAGLLTAGLAVFLIFNPNSYETVSEISPTQPVENVSEQTPAPLGETATVTLAKDGLNELPVKGRAPKTGYARTEFYNSWPTVDGCSLRQRILRRDFGETAVISSEDNCTVLSGAFTEPYTGKYLEFTEKSKISSGLQIDHVVALSDAWQKGAQNLSKDERYRLATDPLNLLAVDAPTNQSKSDGDAATWLPSNKSFHCAYVARQISVKLKYSLWVSQAEKTAMEKVLESCPNEKLVGV